MSILAGITGNVPKLILCVGKPAAKTPTAVGLDANASLANTELNTAALQAALMQSTSGALGGKLSAVKSAFSLPGAAFAKTAAIAKAMNFLAMEVQYNPSTIHFDARPARRVKVRGGAAGSESVGQEFQYTQEMSLDMSFQLVFDDMNPQDAFMMSNWAPTVGNAISGISSIFKSYSVQAQMEGLISLITQKETKQVIVFWAKTCFRGEVIGVTSKYTMFNQKGSPIRGTVDLTIRQTANANNVVDAQYWDGKFNGLFKQSNGLLDKISKATNNNLLNLNL